VVPPPVVVTDPPVVDGGTGPVVPPGPTTFSFAGELTQGGWLRGTAPAGTLAAWLDDVPLVMDLERGFFAALDRDAPAEARLRARLVDGRVMEQMLPIAPRAWDIQHVDASPTGGVPSASYMQRRQPELDAIIAARAQDTRATGWQQDFIWPVTGRISGRFGSQRVYRGQPGSYHSGLDIAPGAGTPYVAPADGTVVLVAAQPFSLEGNLLIVDHGAGLNSAFLHSQSIAVTQGQRVRQSEVLGRVGATGRATGPHLHWSLMWRGRRLDPLLFLPPPG
jgi:hypothetical protein